MNDPNRQQPTNADNNFQADQRFAKTIVVADFEHVKDEAFYKSYCDKDGESAAYRLRWPFKRIVCGAWVTIQFPVDAEAKPIVGAFRSLSQPDHEEPDIAGSFFAVLGEEGNKVDQVAPLVTWGGHCLDDHSLRRVAHKHDLVLPQQLRDYGSRTNGRLDLCEMLYNNKDGIHLSEYAFNLAIPCKPFRGLDIPALVKADAWEAVEEQCAADVMTTAIIAARHLASIAEIPQAGAVCTEAIIEQFCNRKSTPFIRQLQDQYGKT